MKMTLFGLPRMMVAVMALAFLSMGQCIASSPLYLQSWTFSPKGAGNATGLQLIAAGGVPPYIYNVNNNGTDNNYSMTNNIGTFTLNTLNNNYYQYIITDSALNTIQGPHSDSSIHIFQEGQNFSGSTIRTIITPACEGASTGSIQTNATGMGGTDNYIESVTSLGTVTTPPGPAPLTQTLTGVTNGTDYEITVVNELQDSVYLYFDFPSALAAIVVTATPINTTCTGSDIMVTATGGTAAYTTAVAMGTGGGPFTATFSGTSPTTTITNVPAGTYTVTVTDNNTFPMGPTPCSGSVSGVIVPSSPLTFTVGVTNVTCPGGSDGTITVSGVTGGTAPYTYSIGSGFQTSPNFTGLAAGMYTVTVQDSNGCTSQQPATISQPSPITFTVGVTNVTCSGGSDGSITVSGVTGGTAPYTYSIGSGFQTSPNFTGLAAGMYTVTVQDSNGCTSQQPATISQPSPITFTVGVTNVTCPGGSDGSITVSGVTGGTAPYTYSIGSGFQTSPNFTGLAAGMYTVTVQDSNGCISQQPATISQPSPITFTVGVTNVTCPGGSDGSITVSGVTGGTAPYTYSIGSGFQTSPNFTGLAAGMYTVTVKDSNGCISQQPATISQPSPITFTVGVTNVTCSGGSDGTITVSGVTGGTAPYTYSIGSGFQTSPNFTGLAAGMYTVTVQDSNGCISQQPATISQPSPITFTVGVTNVTCSGGSDGTITVSGVTGGTAPYTYSIGSGFQTSPNFTGLAAGMYTVTVQDSNGCTSQQPATISQPSPITFTVGVTNVTCSGGSDGTITVSGVTGGTAPYTYSIGSGFQTSPNFTGLAAGMYTVTVQDSNGCTSQQPATISQPSPITFTVGVTNVTCSGGSDGTITVSGVTGGTAPYTYSIGSGFQTSPNFTGLAAGMYTVTVQDSNGCTSQQPATISQPSPITFTVGVTNVTCSGGSDGSITVSGVTGGTAPYTYSIGSGFQTSPNFTGLAAGMYTVTVQDSNGCTSQQPATISQPSPITFTVGVTNITCSGGPDGAITVSGVTGGTAPYTYSIGGSFQASPNFTGLAAGMYTVTVKDSNGCTSQQPATISQESSLTLTTSSTATSCYLNDGAIQVSVTGGSGSYSAVATSGGITYTFPAFVGGNATLTHLEAGTYIVVVTDTNGCMGTQTVTVNQGCTYVPTCFPGCAR